ncbi:hypothetical protein ACG873_32180 [Mesorhizobium sp. AaZ16]|uniref:hypothetical protein n=1 Tax=Mesorhizobium sp. AaZ16 TaxID=3402289 RepID=UPI00374E9E8B
MAGIAHVLTLARVAELPGEDEDLLHEISIEMEPEDGVIGVHGIGDAYTPAFTDFGLENADSEACRPRDSEMMPPPHSEN